VDTYHPDLIYFDNMGQLPLGQAGLDIAAHYYNSNIARHGGRLEGIINLIGRLTLSRSVETLKGGRFLVVSPFSREQYAAGLSAKPGMGKDPSLVVYNNLGGGVGQVIGYEEGREATLSFDQPTPIDAINSALVNEMFYSPWKG
jgi:hypothetical protein